MVYRIRFAKYGVIKFIGHLDVMRYFQKAVRRSGLPVKYSQGFTPHQIMSFASPLGLGITSDGEYMEIEFEDDELTSEEIFERLRSNITEGFDILSIKQLPPPVPNKHVDKSMALVTAAEYMVSFKDGYEIPFKDKNDLWDHFTKLYNGDEIIVNKKTKKSENATDIKPYIFMASVVNPCTLEQKTTGNGEGYLFNGPLTVYDSKVNNTLHAGEFESDIKLYLRLSAGSMVNIKPELVMEALYQSMGLEFNSSAVEMHRMELYLGNDAFEPMA